jgi:hypothetical protein
MGLIKYGIAVADISGKVSGNVFARNRAGSYVRKWAKPTNTPTAKQSANRLAFGNVSKDWALLTPIQQEAWNTLASTVTRLNRLGEAYTPTGRQIFLESANNMRVLGLTILTDAPISLLQPTIDGSPIVDVEETADALATMAMSGAAAQSGISAVWEASKMFANNKTNFKTDYRQILTGATGATQNLLDAYVAVFGPVAEEDNIVSFRLSYIDTVNGMRSPNLILNSTVVAA